MTQRTGETDRHQLSAFEEPLHPEHRVELERCDRNGGVIQVDGLLLQSTDDVGWQGRDVDLKSERQRTLRTEPTPYTAELLAFDGAVELERVSPESLVPKVSNLDVLRPAATTVSVGLDLLIEAARWNTNIEHMRAQLTPQAEQRQRSWAAALPASHGLSHSYLFDSMERRPWRAPSD